MGNSPAGNRLGSEADVVASQPKKVLSLRVENCTGLEFVLASFEPPELAYVLPKALGSRCSLDLDLDRLGSGCQVVYSTQLNIGSGGRGQEYSVVGKKQGVEQKVATALDLRDSKAGQFFSVFAAMPKGWLYNSSMPVVAASLSQSADDLLRSEASEEGQLGCCSWVVSSRPERMGSFRADVCIVKTNSRTTQGRSSFLDALQSADRNQQASEAGMAAAEARRPASKAKGLIGACQKRNRTPDSNFVGVAAATASSAEAEVDATGVAQDCTNAGYNGTMETTSTDAPEAPDLGTDASPESAELACSLEVAAGIESSSGSAQQATLITKPVQEDAHTLPATTSKVEEGCNDDQIRGNAAPTDSSSTLTPAKRQAPPAQMHGTGSMDQPQLTANHDGHSSSSVTVRAEPPATAIAGGQNSKRPSQGAGGATYDLDGKVRVNRSGAIALKAKAEREERMKREAAEMEKQKREEAAEKEMRATHGQVVASQDAEFELSLLHDSLRSLRKERETLAPQVRGMERALEDANQLRRNAETRLERYGENPKIRAEAERALEAEAQASIALAEAEEEERGRDRLTEVEAAISEKEELLAISALADDM